MLTRLKQEGVYFLFREREDGPEYALADLEDGRYLFAFTTEAKAQVLARMWDAEVGYHPEPEAVFYGLPPEARGLVVDFDPESEEAYLVRREEL